MTMENSEASLDDVDYATLASRPPRNPAHPTAHSECGYSDGVPDLQDESDDNLDDDLSIDNGHYSPPAWRRLENGDRWYGNWRGGNDVLVRRALFKSLSLDHDGDSDAFEAARQTRLPTGSLSPEKGRSPEPDHRNNDDTLVDPMKAESQPSVKQEPVEEGETEKEDHKDGQIAHKSPSPSRDNYIRFAMRADIQQRTEPIDATVSFFRNSYRAVTKSWASFFFATTMLMMSVSMTRMLFQPATFSPVPDLVKVAGLARSFEPLIYYSESGHNQVGDLQATGVAVWDLGESVRSSNMTAAPAIVKSLDELSDSLTTLSLELTKFFANVDGDIDSILIVMDWARREITQLHSLPSPPLATAFSNIHNFLCAAGVFVDPTTGEQTKFGIAATAIFGKSQSQHTQHTLQRTFTEFLSVLEEAIESELQHSLALFSLFEAIDKQFLNLGRLVVHESSLQDEQHADLLSSLWTRILGAKASEVMKYERNRELLANVREKTVRNKGILVEHNTRLLTLKASLETLRRKLVSPLVRSVNSSTLTLEDQIRGLEDVGTYLEGVRQRQKGKLMEIIYGDGNRGRARVAATASARLLDDEPYARQRTL
ncbi:hypothetical protein F4808DRAFT_24726 [Astrocystis sublimbata]|nr:hypothetical protein F4808DRAFT_24726 [Astrocystis sublimbata]